MQETTGQLKYLKRCPAPFGGGECGSAVFYDWGIELLDTRPAVDLRGGELERFRDFAQRTNVKICARCTTPYIIEGGDLIDISAELGPEDVKAILTRGQVLNPHPKIKDP